MPFAIDATSDANFVFGAFAGLIVMAAVLVVPNLARLALVMCAAAIVIGFAADGPLGLYRWLDFAIMRVNSAGDFTTGFEVGQLMAAVLVSALKKFQPED